VNLLAAITHWLPAPRLTRTRIVAAFAIALACDAIQLALLQFGWLGPDEILDVVAFIAVTWLIGFHVLLLPTFAMEFVPVVGMLPTWTGCVAAVVALRGRAQRKAPAEFVGAAPPLLGSPPQLADAPLPPVPPVPPLPQSSEPTEPNPS
jgi:hypothetical protein